MARQLRRVHATFTRPADATTYTAGDEISNSATAALVVPMTFDVSGFRKVRLQKIGIDVTPASGNLVIATFTFWVFIYKTADAPTPVGDNVAATIPGASRNLAARFPIGAATWVNPQGALTAGTNGWQEALPSIPTVNGALLEFTGSEGNGEARTLTANLQTTSAWAPGAVVNVFNVWLDLEVEP